MRVYRLATSLCVVAIVGVGILVGSPAAFAQTTLTVANGTSGSCSGEYSTISAAVAAASSGDTIQVCPGTYPETVNVNIDHLTFDGAQNGKNPVKKAPKAVNESVVANDGGGFILSSSADNTVISGFTIEDAGTTGSGHDAIDAFSGSSGLVVKDNIIRGNNNGINFQNPDGSHAAHIIDNIFKANDQGGNFASNPDTGTGVWITNGPADNTLISGNAFSGDSQTAINFTGDQSNYSTGLVVSDNKSTNDSTFVVAEFSTNALIDGNTITTSPSAPGGFGTGILDFGGDTGLRITNNTLVATGSAGQTGIHVSDDNGTLSDSTTVTGNSVTGYSYGVKGDTGYTSIYLSSNNIQKAGSIGISFASGTSGNDITHNTIGTSAVDCSDQSTGNLTKGTGNTWLSNKGTDHNSTPSGIC
jgi:Right handed beta helix region